MRATPIKTSFNAGELSPLLDMRVDVAKYGNGCKQMLNMIPLVQGPAMKRAGTVFVAETSNSANKSWLATFVFNYQQAFVLEFGVQYIRFYTQRAQATTGTVTAWSNATQYFVGDMASRLGINYYCKVQHTNQQPPNSTYWYVLEANILEIPTPFTGAMLTNDDGTFGLSLVQSGDIIYIATRGYKPQKLTRYSNTKWVIEDVDFSYAAMDATNTDETITVYSDAQTGTVTLTASESGFFDDIPVGGQFLLYQKIDDATMPWEATKSISTNDLRTNDGKIYKALNTATTGFVPPIHTVGAQFDGDGGVQWEYQNPTYGVVRKISSTGTTMSATVLKQIPDGAVGSGNASWVWQYPAWTTSGGYPTFVTFFRQRLTFSRDRTIWFSVAAQYENFARAQFGTVLADSSISTNIDSSDTSEIIYLAPTKQGLFIGTAGAELLVCEETQQEVFSPFNVRVSPSTGYGAHRIKPLRIDDTVLFVQRGGIRLRETQYSFQLDNFTATDLTTLSEHITRGGLLDCAYQLNPYSIIWSVRADGALIGFTYNKAQDALAWHRHIIGGIDVMVESIVTIPSPDGLKDDLWMIVRRTIGGSSVRYVEYMGSEYVEGDDIEDAFYVDSGLTYDGAPADDISGLDHLIGETVQILADGAAHPDKVVNGSGHVLLDREASVVQIGFGYTPLIQTMRIEAGSQDGSAQGKKKRIDSVVIRTLNSQGVLASGDGVDYKNLTFRSSADLMDNPVPLVTGDSEMSWSNGYDTDGYVYITQSVPLPMTILGVIPQVTTYDKT